MPSETLINTWRNTPPGAMPPAGARVAVIVASLGRSEEIGLLLVHLQRQTLLPARIVLSVESARDLPSDIPAGVDIIMGPRSLTAQRNRGLDKVLGDCNIVIFYDDDFVPSDDSLAQIAALFAAHPDIAGATGAVLRDGVKQGGISYRDARIALATAPAPNPAEMRDTDAAYGCNMAFRANAIGATRFDETLPLYAWQEDVDFTGQMLTKGRVVKTSAFSGVHRGVSKGRTPGLKLGYSQIVNPAYLVAKGTMRPRKAITLAMKNMLANHARLLRPEPFIDRAGRARGNWLGLWHLITGRKDPRHALRLG
ncbi:MAG: glycosyltransferase [Rhodospirillales bacterium]|nr:glycosyltransferase [Rhodospirillales bacterium]